MQYQRLFDKCKKNFFFIKFKNIEIKDCYFLSSWKLYLKFFKLDTTVQHNGLFKNHEKCLDLKL